MPEFKRYTYNGVSVQATRRRSSTRDDKKYMRTVMIDGKERLVHYGDPDMPMQRDNKERRANFLSRHSCSEKKDPSKPGFWACYDWKNTAEESADMAKRKKKRITDSPDQVIDPVCLEATVTPLVEGDDFTGRQWEITIIGGADKTVNVDGEDFIRSENGRLYATSGIASSVPQWEGVKVYDNHQTEEEFRKSQGMRSVENEWLGSIVGVVWESATKSLDGTLKIVKDSLATMLKNAHDQGILDTIGLSITAFPKMTREAQLEGVSMPIIDGFEHILSVDLVGNPAAGGRFNRILAAVDHSEGSSINEEVIEMDEEKLAELLSQTVAPLSEGVDEIRATVGTLNEGLQDLSDRVATLESAGTEEAVEESEEVEAVEVESDEAEDAQDDDTADAVETVAQEAIRDINLAKCELMLEQRLAQANLPDKFQKPIRQAFAGRIFEGQDLDQMIQSQKEAQAAVDTSGRVTESANQRNDISVGLSPQEKIGIEVLRLTAKDVEFGELEHNTERFVQERVSEAGFYKSWINSGKPNTGNYRKMSDLVYDLFGGDPLLDGNVRFTESSTLATAIKNTLNILIAADYSLQERWYEPIVQTEQVETIHDATLARFYGLSSLDVVDEGNAYTELAQNDEEETAVFVKKGNFVGVTMEQLMRDRLNYFRSIPRRLSDSWYNSLSDLTANVFTTNSDAGPVLSDTGALFNATAATTAGGHANLLTTALSHSAFSAARTAMRKQTNQPLGAGRKIQINPRFLLVPEDLEVTGLNIRNSELVPEADGAGTTGNQTANQFRNSFEVIPVPSWTDANNWALVGDPARFPAIYHIFPRGGATPQLFTADNEASGAMFTNDELRFKVRMLTYRFSADHDCAPVADFRPLHKSNVA